MGESSIGMIHHAHVDKSAQVGEVVIKNDNGEFKTSGINGTVWLHAIY